MAPSKFAFKIFAPVKSASKRLLLIKLVSIKDDPLRLTLVKFALEKLAFSKMPPSRLASYRLVLMNEDSIKFPLVFVYDIVGIYSKSTVDSDHKHSNYIS